MRTALYPLRPYRAPYAPVHCDSRGTHPIINPTINYLSALLRRLTGKNCPQ